MSAMDALDCLHSGWLLILIMRNHLDLLERKAVQCARGGHQRNSQALRR